MSLIGQLIDKKDNFEIIRDKIADILLSEIANQKNLAEEAAKDPQAWDIRIFLERCSPWDLWLDNTPSDTRPIVNITYDHGVINTLGSNQVSRQKVTSMFHIDCIALGISKDNPEGGHIAGDQNGTFNVQATVRLIRNIIMAPHYHQLKLMGTVSRRWVEKVEFFKPDNDQSFIHKIYGARLSLNVDHNELTPQIEEEKLSEINVDFERSETGEIYATNTINF